MRRKGTLGTREMVILALIDEGPTHGYAIAGLLATDGDLGRIWSLGRPLTYRTIDRLREDKLIADAGLEVGQSAPDRKLLQTTAAGRETVARWLVTPEPRIREFRPALLYKLELLRRRGLDRRPLLHAQRELVVERSTAKALGGSAPTDGVEELLREWRISQHAIAVSFLDRLLAAASEDAPAAPPGPPSHAAG